MPPSSPPPYLLPQVEWNDVVILGVKDQQGARDVVDAVTQKQPE